MNLRELFRNIKTKELEIGNPDGKVICPYTHVQTDPLIEWNVNHSNNSLLLAVQVYVDDILVEPDAIVIDTLNRFTVKFLEPTVGRVNFVILRTDNGECGDIVVTPTPTATVTPTLTPTTTVTPTITPSVTVSPTITPTVTATTDLTPTVTVTPTATPIGSATPTPTAPVTPSITPTNSITPTPSFTPGPSFGATPTPTATATATPTATPTPTVTVTPSPSPSPSDVSALILDEAIVRYNFGASEFTGLIADGINNISVGTVDPYVIFTSGGISTPNSVASDLTTVMDVRAYVRKTDYNAGMVTEIIASKWNVVSNQRGFAFGFKNDKLVLSISDNGSTIEEQLSADVLPYANNTWKWLRFTYDGTVSELKFYDSDDGTNWNQIGTTISTTATTAFSNTSDLYVGDVSSNTETLDGAIQRVEFHDTIDGITPDVLFDATERVSGNSWLSSIGETWTRDIDSTFFVDSTPKHHVYLPSGSGNSVGTTAYSPSGDLDLQIEVAPDSWDTASTQTLIARYDTDTDTRAFEFSIDGTASNGLNLNVSDDGTSQEALYSGSILPFVSGQRIWLRATYNTSTTTANFYYSDDNRTTWQSLGTDSGTIASIFSTANPLYIGASNDGTTNTWSGKVYRAVIYETVDGITPVKDFNPSNKTLFSDTDWLAPTGETWTPEGTSIIREEFDLDTTLDTNDNMILPPGTLYLNGNSGTYGESIDVDIIADLTLIAYVSLDDVTPASTSTIISKYVVAGDNRAFNFNVDSSGNLSILISSDGTAANTDTITSSVILPATAGVLLWVRASFDATNQEVTFFTSTDPSNIQMGSMTWTELGVAQATTVSSINTNSINIELGSSELGTSNMWTGTISKVYAINSINPLDDAIITFDATEYVDSNTLSSPNTFISHGTQWSLFGDYVIQNSKYNSIFTFGDGGFETSISDNLSPPFTIMFNAKFTDISPSADQIIFDSRSSATNFIKIFTDFSNSNNITLETNAGAVVIPESYHNSYRVHKIQVNSSGVIYTISGIGTISQDSIIGLVEFVTLLSDRSAGDNGSMMFGDVLIWDGILNVSDTNTAYEYLISQTVSPFDKSVVHYKSENVQYSNESIVGIKNSATGLGIPYARYDGTSGNHLSTPDSTSVSLNSDFDIRIWLQCDDWATSTTRTLISKYDATGSDRSYIFYIDNSNNLALTISDDGAFDAGNDVSSGTVISYANGTPKWVRVTYDSSVPEVQFHDSDDGETWDTVGTAQSVLATSIHDSTITLEVGSGESGTLDVLSGANVFKALIYDVADNNSLVANMDIGERRFGNTWTSQLTGETWTRNNELVIQNGKSQTYGLLTGASGDYIFADDSATNSLTGDIDIRINLALDEYDSGVAQALAGKYNSSTDNRGFLFLINADNELELIISDDGIFSASDLANTGVSLSSFPDSSNVWFRVTYDASTSDVIFYWSDDGIVWNQMGTTQTITATSIFDSAADFEIGTNTAGTLDPASGRFYRVELYDTIDGTTPVSVFDPIENITIGSTTWTSIINAEIWNISGNSLVRTEYDLDTVNGTDTSIKRLDEGDVYLDGTTNSYITGPTDSITTDLSVIAYVEPNDWTVIGTILSKWVTGTDNRSHTFAIKPTGTLEVSLSDDGTAVVTSTSTTTVGFDDGHGAWVRYTFDNTLDEVSFYTSTESPLTAIDDITWTQLGTTVSSVLTGIHASTETIEIGSINSGSDLFVGNIRRVATIASTDPTVVPENDFDGRNYIKNGTSITSGGDVYSFADDIIVHKTGSNLLFANGSSLETSIGELINSSFTVMVAARFTKITPTADQFLLDSRDSAPNKLSIYSDFSDSNNFTIETTDGGAQSIAASYDDDWHIHIIEQTPTSLNYEIPGVGSATTITSPTLWELITLFGSRGASNSPILFGEFVLWDRILTEEERKQAIEDLRDKYEL